MRPVALLALLTPLLAALAAPANAQERRPPAERPAGVREKAPSSRPAPKKRTPVPERLLEIPRRPFPTDLPPARFLAWTQDARARTLFAIYRARGQRDADEVSRLVVLLQDIQEHLAKEAQRVLKEVRGKAPGGAPAKRR